MSRTLTEVNSDLSQAGSAQQDVSAVSDVLLLERVLIDFAVVVGPSVQGRHKHFPDVLPKEGSAAHLQRRRGGGCDREENQQECPARWCSIVS